MARLKLWLSAHPRLRPLLIGLPVFILVWELAAVWRVADIAWLYLLPFGARIGEKFAAIAMAKYPWSVATGFFFVGVLFIVPMWAFLRGMRALRQRFNRHR
jgi:hypothetical protein